VRAEGGTLALRMSDSAVAHQPPSLALVVLLPNRAGGTQLGEALYRGDAGIGGVGASQRGGQRGHCGTQLLRRGLCRVVGQTTTWRSLLTHLASLEPRSLDLCSRGQHKGAYPAVSACVGSTALHRHPDSVPAVRIAVVGKGGAGKSVISGTIARLLAREGKRVLALDSDLLPGLSLSLGAAPDPPEPPLREAAEKDEDGRWRLKKGIGPVRAVQRYATDAPDGIRLLQAGKTSRAGLEPIMGSVNAYYRVVHRLRRAQAFEDWALIGDLPAGPRHIAFDWAPYADLYVAVVQPSAQSALTARRVARIARMREGVRAVFVANRVTGAADIRRVEELVGEPLLAAVPNDEAVARAERLGLAPIDEAAGSPAVLEIERLVTALAGE